MENRVARFEDAGIDSHMLPRELLQLAQDGEVNLASELFSIFQSDTASRLEVLSRAVQSGETVLISKQAHALKGSAGQVGAQPMAEICRQIELSAAAGNMADLSMQLDRLQLQFAEICRAMSRLSAGGLSYGI